MNLHAKRPAPERRPDGHGSDELSLDDLDRISGGLNPQPIPPGSARLMFGARSAGAGSGFAPMNTQIGSPPVRILPPSPC